jgi:endoglucanase
MGIGVLYADSQSHLCISGRGGDKHMEETNAMKAKKAKKTKKTKKTKKFKRKYVIISIALITLVCTITLIASKKSHTDVSNAAYVPIDNEMRDISSWELVKEIKTGWNLGNSLDIFNRGGLYAEIAWGNPYTTYEMIQAVADAGFDSVRVPITWQRHLGDAPDYLINEEWLDRVEEVVGYVLSTGMYCIINTHHEQWIHPDVANEQQNTEQLVAIWSQISERFKNYNEKLIFNSMNEPRLRDTEDEWNGGTHEAQEVVNRLNAAFINTVRSSGGRNELRHLLIPSYAASAEIVAMEALSNDFPQDDDKIIALINSYTPYNLALNPRGIDKWVPAAHEQDIDFLFDNLKNFFLDKGIPVIIGETGILNKNNNHGTRLTWTSYYFGKARELGIPTFWWDNGVFEEDRTKIEVLGLLDRYEAEFVYPDIVDTIMGNS